MTINLYIKKLRYLLTTVEIVNEKQHQQSLNQIRYEIIIKSKIYHMLHIHMRNIK